MTCTSRRRRAAAATACLLALLPACGETIDDPALRKPIPFEPERPTLGTPIEAPRYAGGDPAVKEAQETLATGLDLHAQVIYRTCSPNGGVCHNSKEYPDLRTPTKLLETIGAACNVQPGTPEAVFDRCERPGDRVRLGDKTAELGSLKYVAGDMGEAGELPGLHLRVAEPIVDGDKETADATVRFFRSFVTGGAVEDLAVASFYARWRVLDGGRHLVGEVPQNRIDAAQDLLASDIVQGDHNRNGTFGARLAPPIQLLVPGKPEESYLIARLRGLMKQGGIDVAVPGTRMPLANQPLSIPEMLGLFCFVEGLAKQPAPFNIGSGIDYVGCSYAKDPGSLNLLGAGVTWKRRVRLILEASCVGCHAGAQPQGDLDLMSGNVYARLLAPSKQKPALPLVTPRDSAKSYLYLKLIGDPTIVGVRMPVSQDGEAKLGAAELADIKAWIDAGAVEDQ